MSINAQPFNLHNIHISHSNNYTKNRMKWREGLLWSSFDLLLGKMLQ